VEVGLAGDDSLGPCGDRGKIAEYCVIARTLNILLDQVAVRRHKMQIATLLKQRLVTQRTITMICGFDLQRRQGGRRVESANTVVHGINVPRIQNRFYSFPLQKTGFL
jgi:hypothetical protein